MAIAASNQNQRPNSTQVFCVFPNIAFDDELRYNKNGASYTKTGVDDV
jgi:hypothetical protein